MGEPVLRLDIDTGGYDTAADSLVGANRLVAGGYSTLTSKLGGFAAMGGDDKSSEDFVKNYDGAAAEVVGGIAELSTAFGTLATLSAASGANHRRANAGSVYKKSAPADDSSGIPGGDPETVSAYTPPSSLGADSQDLPEFWNLIVDHLQGYAWPSADVERLRQAASAWRTMGSDLDRAPSYVEVATSQLGAQRSPEIVMARTALGEVKGTATDLATECRNLAASCDEYAEKVETTRETVIGLLKDLAIEIGATAVISGIASFVTFGGAAVVGAGVATARAISCARKIIAAIKAIKVIRAIGTMARTLPKARSIRSVLKKFQNIKAARRAAKQIDNELWQQGKKFTSKAEDALSHFNKHKGEFPGVKNAKEYVEAAKKFMTDPPPGTYTRVRDRDGAILRYNPESGTLGIMGKDGTMNTMFKPTLEKVQKQNYTDVWDYFLHG
ncbi:MAG: hypothetical protein H0X12_14810 [Nocardioides sp.]|nr:hypothetical protein [Nocardioides sp.]